MSTPKIHYPEFAEIVTYHILDFEISFIVTFQPRTLRNHYTYKYIFVISSPSIFIALTSYLGMNIVQQDALLNLSILKVPESSWTILS